MEWEYLQGRFGIEREGDLHFIIVTVGPGDNKRGHATFDQLGADRWELCGMTAIKNDVFLIFKRQKLHAVGLTPKQRAMLDE